jgi:hypothetical protein
MTEILISFIILSTMVCIYLLLAKNLEGTKGISKNKYYGRNTGKIYTAKKGRRDYII